MTHSKNTDTPIRFVTAASLFDGHDASINIMRRVLQAQGAEVIHLGHDRSAQDVVEAAIQEDAHGIAVSSYQGGHIEYFTYMVELLAFRAERISASLAVAVQSLTKRSNYFRARS